MMSVRIITYALDSAIVVSLFISIYAVSLYL